MKNKTKFLPKSPGCYLFKNNDGIIIYIGKAKNLRKRVSSYFQKKDHDAKTLALVKEISDIDTIVTSTEAEALLLENNLIKKYTPVYNLDLRASHKYAYLRVFEGDVPWIEVVRSREKTGEYYGPFVSGRVRKLILDVLQRNFRVFTHKPSAKTKKIVDKIQYKEIIEQARKILSGKVDELIRELENKMKEASSKTFYEYALTLRNQIEALKTLKEKQLVEFNAMVESNVINYQRVGDEVYLIVFSIRKGILEEKQTYNFDYFEDFLENFFLEYYESATIPKEIIIPEKTSVAISKYLSEKRGGKVKIIFPQSGDKKELLELANQNLIATFFAGEERLRELKKILALEKLPHLIECFDISHLGGTNVVASMVAFADGFPNKSSYRKFKISKNVNDDYSAMKEVVTRRYSGSLSKKMPFPNIIVVDGGLGQLHSAKESLIQIDVKIPVIALAKKFEEIYTEHRIEPLIVDRKNKGLQLLQAIRDEAHRFAVSYQRNLRKNGLK